MRFGRLILASLAPLLGLSAVSAAMLAATSPGPVVSNEQALTRLLLSVVTPMADSSDLSVRAERPSPQAVLPIAALAETPFRHSLWMVSSHTLVPFSPHSQHFSQLRC